MGEVGRNRMTGTGGLASRVLLTVLGAILILPPLVLVIGIHLYDPDYDEEDRDFPLIESQLADIRSAMHATNRGPSAPAINLDLRGLNNGDWRVACVFGGYADPVRTMERTGADISAFDRARLDPRRGFPFRIAAVEEFEFLVAYVDGDNRAKFIHMSYGIGSAGQHFEQCVDRETPLVALF